MREARQSSLPQNPKDVCPECGGLPKTRLDNGQSEGDQGHHFGRQLTKELVHGVHGVGQLGLPLG
jgi:hypothetical protein